MLAVAMGVEADAFVAQHSGVALPDGRQRVVRHGHGPMRRIQTGVGPLEVQRPKVRDRADVPEAEKIRFTSVILPRWARRSKSLDALLPVLDLRGISTGDFQEALAGLLGKDAPNLSPSVIGRLTAAWRANTTLGVAVTCRPAATSTSGPTGSTSRPAWSQSRNACWW